MSMNKSYGIVNEIRKRISVSNAHKSNRVDKWRKLDELLTAYIPEDDYNRYLKQKDNNIQLSFVLPLSFAVREIFLTSLHDIFLKDNEIYHLVGTADASSRASAILLAKILNKQAIWFKHKLALDAIWSNSITYGFGRGIVQWNKRIGKREITNVVDDMQALAFQLMGKNINAGDVIKQLVDEVMFEGNEIIPISPYDAIIDPNCSPNNLKEAEFVGWVWRATKNNLLLRQRDPEYYLMNCEKINPANRNYGSFFSLTDAKLEGMPSIFNTYSFDSDTVELATIIMNIIPSEFFKNINTEELKIDKDLLSDTPEKWQFTIAHDNTIVQCFPLPHWHGNFPVIDCAINDGYCSLPTSHLMAIYPFQLFANWLMKARAISVLRSLNGKIIADNSKVELDDILDMDMPLIRVKASAYGAGDVRQFVHQLQFPDVNQQYLNDITFIDQMAKQGIGVTDIMMGNMRGMPERPTATGIQAITSSSYGRIARLAMIINEQFMNELIYQMAYNTQQWMDKEVFIKLVGEKFENEIRNLYDIQDDDIIVTRDMIQTSFEVDPKTNLNPYQTDLQAMVQLMQILMQNPNAVSQLMTSYDLTKVFETIMLKLGLENIQDFKIEVKPDEQVQKESQAGNIVPVEKINPMEEIL